MLQITIPPAEFYDENSETFLNTKEQTLQLEHSLVSLSKWESRWNKSFLATVEKTHEESIDYIRCMTITQNVDPNVYLAINDEIMTKVTEYIDLPMTATTFREDLNKGHSREIITSEIIYQWMISLGVPFECQKWHLNRLLTLIRVCSLKQQQPKKMSKNELYSRNRKLNAARKKSLHTKG